MWEVSAFKAPSWQRIDIAFHSATHSVTWLPFPPQGLLSWELACQPETMWVGGVRFDWDVEQLEEERGARKSHWGYMLKWLWLPCCSVNAKLLCGEFLFLCSCEWNVCANASTLAFIVSWAYCRSLYLFNLCCLRAHAMNHEAVRQYVSEAWLLLPLHRVLTLSEIRRTLHNFSLLQLNQVDQTHTFARARSPPDPINNHGSGSLFSWWIWYWLYGLLLHLQRADMVGSLRLDGVSWGGWIDPPIDNSFFLSVRADILLLQEDGMPRLERRGN